MCRREAATEKRRKKSSAKMQSLKKRVAGLEPVTSTLARSRSTN